LLTVGHAATRLFIQPRVAKDAGTVHSTMRNDDLDAGSSSAPDDELENAVGE
jgi:hypothetical protein